MTTLYYVASAFALLLAWQSFGLVGKWWLSRIFTYIYLALMLFLGYMFFAVEQKSLYIIGSFAALFMAIWSFFLKYVIQFYIPEKRTKLQQEWLEELEKRNNKED